MNGAFGRRMIDDDNDEEDDGIVFNDRRHTGVFTELTQYSPIWEEKSRIQTVQAEIVLCLNIGIDPPQGCQTSLCDNLQAWCDLSTVAIGTSFKNGKIAESLIRQYKHLHPNLRFRTCLDPTKDRFMHSLDSMRQSAPKERVLFHYNGHGVPMPTDSGEIWVLSRDKHSYRPVALREVHRSVGSPAIFVFDCANGSMIVKKLRSFVHEQQIIFIKYPELLDLFPEEAEAIGRPGWTPDLDIPYALAATDGTSLPNVPGLPADLFTSCLTTPLKTFLHWFIKFQPRKLSQRISIDLIDLIPGDLADRKTPLGELNWMLMAVTDCIAFSTVCKDAFLLLFREDLLVSSLFRNFLVAQRIYHTFDMAPISTPAIPSTHHHAMWGQLDVAFARLLEQLYHMLNPSLESLYIGHDYGQFYEEQFLLFAEWLADDPSADNPPQMLPILLQEFASASFQTQALLLLAKYLSLGTLAVGTALKVGIYPFALRLLKTSTAELKPLVLFIWTKIMAHHYSTYQRDVLPEYRFFLDFILDQYASPQCRVMATFVICMVMRRNPEAQEKISKCDEPNAADSIIDIAIGLFHDDRLYCSELRKWLLLCLGLAWEDNQLVREVATRKGVPHELYIFFGDAHPEVRAAVVFALGSFINSTTLRCEHVTQTDRQIMSVMARKLLSDSSMLVRKELLAAIQWFVLIYEHDFVRILNAKVLMNTHPTRNFHLDSQPLPDDFVGKTFGPDSRGTRNSTTTNNNNNIVASYRSRFPIFCNIFLQTDSNAFSWETLEQYMIDPSEKIRQMATKILNEIVHKRNDLMANRARNQDTTVQRSIETASDERPESYLRFFRNRANPRPWPRPRVGVDHLISIPSPACKGECCNEEILLWTIDMEVPARREWLIETNFVDWCIEQFRDRCTGNSYCICPNGDHVDPDESSVYSREVARKHYKTAAKKELTEGNDGTRPLLDSNDVLRPRVVTMKKEFFKYQSLMYHPYENIVIACDFMRFAWWEHTTANRSGMMLINDDKMVKITDMNLVNAQDDPQLMVATNDGAIRVWRNILLPTFSPQVSIEHWFRLNPKLSTSFFIFEEMSDQLNDEHDNLKLVFSWLDRYRTMVACDGGQVLRLWDARIERKVGNIHTGLDKVTSLETDNDYMMCTGSNEGVVKLFDCRAHKATPCQVFNGSEWPILKAKTLPGGAYLVAGNEKGELRWYDKRFPKHQLNLEKLHQPLISMAFHPNTDVFACAYGAEEGIIQLYSVNGTRGPKITIGDQVAETLTFHPFKSELGFFTSQKSLVLLKVPLREQVSLTL